MKSLITFAAALMTFLWAQAAFAVCGHSVGPVEMDVLDMGAGSSVILFKMDTRQIVDDPSHPVHLTAGECKGMGTVTEGVQFWTGACVRKDADGDVFVDSWDASVREDGTFGGNWKTEAGSTGKFVALYEAGVGGTWTVMGDGLVHWCEE